MADPLSLLGRIDELLDDAAGVPLSCLTCEQHRAWSVGVQRLRARIDALACLALRDAPLSLDAPVSRRTLGDEVAASAHADRRVVAGDQALAVWLRRFPELAEAFSAGWVTRSHLGVLRRLDNTRTHRHLVEAQNYLITAARSMDFIDFGHACQSWLNRFDPDGAEPAEQVAKRGLSHTTAPDGMVSGRFLLDPLAGHAFITALERQAQRLYDADHAADDASAEAGEDGPPPRTASQRRADALVQLVAKGAANPGATPADPLIHVVVGAKVAEAMIAQAVGGETPDELPLDHADIDGRCELINGTPLHPKFLLALLATATFRRMIFGPAGEITDLGRRTRGFPARLKQALLVQARGRCRSPGCDAPFTWLQADHLIPWRHDGTTSLANGQILCDPHNKAKGDRLPDAEPGGAQ